MPYAFRCRQCGHLDTSEHAGEAATPTSCRICSAGITFDRKGNRTFQPENWEVLAEATPERLAQLGLTPEDVESHEGVPLGGMQAAPPKTITRDVRESVVSKDKA